MGLKENEEVCINNLWEAKGAYDGRISPRTTASMALTRRKVDMPMAVKALMTMSITLTRPPPWGDTPMDRQASAVSIRAMYILLVPTRYRAGLWGSASPAEA